MKQDARDIKTLGLEDCGKIVRVYNPDFRNSSITYDAEIQMVIKSPKGTLVLFNRPGFPESQSKLIKAFVDTYKND